MTLHKTFNLQQNLTIFLLNGFYNDLSPYKKNHRLISYISHLAASTVGCEDVEYLQCVRCVQFMLVDHHKT